MRLVAEETTDHELVARVREGDDRAFECLYTRYHRRIAAYVQGMVKDHARAEDVTQDVFMSALRRMRDTDRPIAFKPWIYEIAKNACIDQFRRSKRAEEVSYDAEDGLASADYGKLVTKDPPPERAFESKQQLDHLRGAFGGLSETHHQILVMRELEGLSYREIGERLGMTRPAVESTLFRARRRLTEEYEDLVTGERCQRVQGIIAMAASQTAALGARDRKRLAKHVSYCQPCLRHARMSGLDARDLTHVPTRAKIAALLPLPAFIKKKLLGVEAASGSGAGPSPDVTSSVAMWSTHASTVDPGAVAGWGKAAMGAATIALAGVGAGVATAPPDSARAGADRGSLIERVRGGSDDGGSQSAAVQAVPISLSGTGAPGAGASGGSGAAGKGSGAGGGKTTVAKAKSGSGAVSGGSGSSSGTAGGSGAGAGGPGTLAPGGAPAADGSSSSPKSSSSDSGTTSSSSGGGAKEPAKKDPVTEAVSGVTGAVTGATGSTGSTGSGTTSGSGTGGGTTQTPTQTQPTIRLPTLPTPPPPDPTQPAPDPVGDVVEGAAGAVDGLLDGVNKTVDGVTGILAPK